MQVRSLVNGDLFSWVGYFKNGNSLLSPTSQIPCGKWDGGIHNPHFPSPSQVGCGEISRPDILDWEVGSLKVGSGTQTRIPVFKISYSARSYTYQIRENVANSRTGGQPTLTALWFVGWLLNQWRRVDFRKPWIMIQILRHFVSCKATC